MKKLLFAVSALAALSLLAPTTGIAGAYNQLGFYTDGEMTASSATAAAYTTVEIYLVISNPWNEVEDRAIASISGVEVTFSIPDNGLDQATIWTNGTGTDFGDAINGHFVGWGTPVPVADEMCHLATKTIFLMNVNPFVAHVAPHTLNPSIPGHMAILDFDGSTIQKVYPSSGSYDDPVFGFNTTVVATEETSFDGLKALYR